jgi:phthalate 4,5-dioxygenase
MNQEDAEALVHVGAGTITGNLFRRYWIPACLSEEVPDRDGAPIRFRLLGEDLVAFRDTNGVVGLVDAFCPHRRAPMFFGRNEECGLRCVYHGWKFDAEGTCVDMPSEPPDSLFKTKVKIGAYPTWEAGGLVWTYMGPADKRPPTPDYEYLRVPASHRHVSKTLQSCNYLQALDGGVDTSHSSFLHNEDMRSNNGLRARDGAPRIELEKTAYGFTYVGTRNVGDDGLYCRVYHYMLPTVQVRGFVTKWTSAEPHETPTIHGHFWIPIDDETTWMYNYMYGVDAAAEITPEFAEGFESWTGRGREHVLPGYRLKANLENDYFLDRERQKTLTYTGIPGGANTQDIAITEGMGPIADRTKEHLGTSDRAVITARTLLLEAGRDVAEGRDPRGLDPATYRGVRAYDAVVKRDQDWRALEPQLIAKW